MDDSSKGKEDQFFYQINESGDLEKIDILSGDIVSVSPQFEGSLVGRNTPIHPEFVKGKSKTWYYTPVYRDIICQKIADGQTLTSIAKTAGMPKLGTITRWRLEHEDFALALKAARMARATIYADRVAETLEETRGLEKDDIPAEKLFLEKAKWLAEKDDPREYGRAASEGGDGHTTIVINTGIDRPEPRILEGEVVPKEKE